MHKVTGLLTGCFDGLDGLHQGHIYFLTQAKKYCDYLIVCINNDNYIRDFKGREPKTLLNRRIEKVKETELVDEVCIFYSSPLNLILENKPKYIFVGSDYETENKNVVGYPECLEWGGEVRVIHPRWPGLSTTEILKNNK